MGPGPLAHIQGNESWASINSDWSSVDCYQKNIYIYVYIYIYIYIKSYTYTYTYIYITSQMFPISSDLIPRVLYYFIYFLVFAINICLYTIFSYILFGPESLGLPVCKSTGQPRLAWILDPLAWRVAYVIYCGLGPASPGVPGFSRKLQSRSTRGQD